MLQFLKERLQRGGTDLVAKFVTEFVCDSGGGLGNSGCPVGLLLSGALARAGLSPAAGTTPSLKWHCSVAPSSVSGSAMMRARSHRVAAPLLALGAAIVACLSLTKSLAFTGSPSMTLLKGEEAGRAVQVSMGQSIQGPCKRKVKRSPVSSSFKSAKAKQAERSLARKTAAEQAKVRVPMQWPATIPEGVTLLHLEYDVAPKDEIEAEMAKRAFSTFPKPGNKEVEDFIRKVQKTFGPKVRVALNEPMVLKELLPEGSTIKYRKGAFEVMNLNTGKLMFSKLQTGVSPVYEEFDYFAKKVMATIS
ncbi:unnamed protein product [Symbiodinium necroappetens]|uniref:Uncharacterized protein n=1 Tax=Symbiodinium necroappetens TaxID=1628268 RepID=A0A812LGV3_9DINO|nr:unnamed protein product [Symbiodinium necroappetens]